MRDGLSPIIADLVRAEILRLIDTMVRPNGEPYTGDRDTVIGWVMRLTKIAGLLGE